MWFHQNGAPQHLRKQVTVSFNPRTVDTPNWWIGQGDPVHWPAVSTLVINQIHVKSFPLTKFYKVRSKRFDTTVPE